jgi:hypothetical protein
MTTPAGLALSYRRVFVCATTSSVYEFLGRCTRVGNEVPETSLAVNRTVRGVGERALKPPPYGEDGERTVMVANWARESRPSGMKGGLTET